MKTENILVWLDALQAQLPTGQNEAVAQQFHAVKCHLVGLANEKRDTLSWATTDELFTEIASRNQASLLGTVSEHEGVVRRHLGSHVELIGLASVLLTSFPPMQFRDAGPASDGG